MLVKIPINLLKLKKNLFFVPKGQKKGFDEKHLHICKASY